MPGILESVFWLCISYKTDCYLFVADGYYYVAFTLKEEHNLRLFEG